MKRYRLMVGLLLAVVLPGCLSMASQRMTEHLKAAMLGQDDPERRIRLSNRAFGYASRGLCVSQPTICATRET